MNYKIIKISSAALAVTLVITSFPMSRVCAKNGFSIDMSKLKRCDMRDDILFRAVEGDYGQYNRLNRFSCINSKPMLDQEKKKSDEKKQKELEDVQKGFQGIVETVAQQPIGALKDGSTKVVKNVGGAAGAVFEIKNVYDNAQSLTNPQDSGYIGSPVVELVNNTAESVQIVSTFLDPEGTTGMGTTGQVVRDMLNGPNDMRKDEINKYWSDKWRKVPGSRDADKLVHDANATVQEMFSYGSSEEYTKQVRDKGLDAEYNHGSDSQEEWKGSNYLKKLRHEKVMQLSKELQKGNEKSEKVNTLLKQIDNIDKMLKNQTENPEGMTVKKPNIYIYPEGETRLQVAFEDVYKVTTSVPEYGNGWSINAMPDGTLYDETGKNYGYLFYECHATTSDFQTEEGFIIESANREYVFRDILECYGFNETEINDFIEYWSAYLDKDTDYVMYPLNTEAVDEIMPVTFSKNPDSIYRIWFGFKAVSSKTIVNEPIIEHISRDGFTIVEWGGVIL